MNAIVRAAKRGAGKRTWMAEHPLTVYFVLVFTIPIVVVGPWLIFPEVYYALHGEPFEMFRLIEETAEMLGMDFHWELYNLILICLEAPVLWAMIIYAGAPTIAAFIVAGVVLRNGEGRRLISRFKPWRDGVSVRQGIKIWAIVLALVVGADFLTLGMRLLVGIEGVSDHYASYQVFSLGFLIAALTTLFFDMGGVLEEAGWHGIALPMLKIQAPSPLAASLILGVIWAIWHIPRDLASGYHADGLSMYMLSLLIFIISCLSFSVVMGLFFNLTGGSALIAIAIHGSINDIIGLSGLAQAELTSSEFQVRVATRALPYLLAAIFIAWKYGRRLGDLGRDRASIQNRAASAPRGHNL